MAEMKQGERILRLRELLLEQTDENNYITLEDIARILQANKRTIEQDIDTLIQSGMDIEKQSRPKLAYAVLSRDFTLQEVKLLLDCVQTSKPLSEKKTEELTKKLCGLCSQHEAEQLKGQVHNNHIKSGNEGIYRYIDMIQKAIAESLFLSFTYGEQKAVVCPCSLVYADNNYFLFAIVVENVNSFYKDITAFRLDRMANMETLDNFGQINAVAFHARTRHRHQNDMQNCNAQNFSVYGGKVERITLEFPEGLARTILDCFGSGAHIVKEKNGKCRITLNAAVNPQFFGWVFSLGKEVKIIEPQKVAQEMKNLLKENYAVYIVPRNRKKKPESSQ